MNLDQALLVERHVAEWFRSSAVVPGAERHDDPDVTWVVKPGSVLGQRGGRWCDSPRRRRPSRLDTLVARYRDDGRGMGLWISPPRRRTTSRICCAGAAAQLPEAVSRDGSRPRGAARGATRCREASRSARVEDPVGIRKAPHPSIGPITTAAAPRRCSTASAARLLARSVRAPWRFVAVARRQAGRREPAVPGHGMRGIARSDGDRGASRTRLRRGAV